MDVRSVIVVATTVAQRVVAHRPDLVVDVFVVAGHTQQNLVEQVVLVTELVLDRARWRHTRISHLVDQIATPGVVTNAVADVRRRPLVHVTVVEEQLGLVADRMRNTQTRAKEQFSDVLQRDRTKSVVLAVFVQCVPRKHHPAPRTRDRVIRGADVDHREISGADPVGPQPDVGHKARELHFVLGVDAAPELTVNLRVLQATAVHRWVNPLVQKPDLVTVQLETGVDLVMRRNLTHDRVGKVERA